MSPIKLRELKMLLDELHKPYSSISTNLGFRIITEALIELGEKDQTAKDMVDVLNSNAVTADSVKINIRGLDEKV